MVMQAMVECVKTSSKSPSRNNTIPETHPANAAETGWLEYVSCPFEMVHFGGGPVNFRGKKAQTNSPPESESSMTHQWRELVIHQILGWQQIQVFDEEIEAWKNTK